jgi:hypothetical protein
MHPKLDIGKAFEQAWHIFKKSWKQLFGLQAISAAAIAIFYAFFMIGIKYFIPQMEENTVDNWIFPLIGAGAALFILMLLLSVWITGANCIVVNRASTGESITISDALKAAWSSFGRLISFYLVVTGAILFIYAAIGIPIGFLISGAKGGEERIVAVILLVVVLLFVFMIGLAVLSTWLWIKLGFVPFAIAVERKSVGDSLRRSFGLSKNNFWASLAVIYLGSMVVGFAVSLVIYAIFIPTTFLSIASMVKMHSDDFLPFGFIVGTIFAMFIGQTAAGMGVWPLWGSVYAHLSKSLNTPR